MRATKAITDILTAMGATPVVVTDRNGNDLVKVNAPAVRSCENCANRDSCTKTAGNIFGFCNSDYKEG